MEQPATLRLEIDPADAPRLATLSAVRDRSPGRATSRRSSRVFYDTPDRQLALNNIVFEVRQDGRRHIQSVRAEGAMIEGEAVTRVSETALRSATADPSAIEDAGLRQATTPLPGLKLGAVCRLDLRRTTRRLGTDTGIVLTLTDGEMKAGKTVRPVADLELSGPPDDAAALYDLALALQAETSLRLASETREAQALRLASGREPAWRKAVPLDLPAAATVEETLALILHHCLDHLIDNEACTLTSDHPEGVHQMRVAMRRMRSALRIFRPLLPAEPYARITDDVRWVTAGLADARDLDVFTEEIVGPVADAFPDEPAFAAIKQCLAVEGAKARAAARATVASDRFTRFLLETGAWIAKRGWRDQPVNETSTRLFQPITDLAAELLSTRFRKVCKRGRKFTDLSPEERHQLRIDVKKLRYASDFFASLYGRKRVRAFTAVLGKLQDGLGYMNDVAVARGLVERLETAVDDTDAPAVRQAGAILTGWHTRAAAEAAGSLAADVEALITSTPFWLDGVGEAP